MDEPKQKTTITAITVADLSNPIEIQAWIDNNPNAGIVEFTVSGNTFFIMYL